MLMLTRPIHPVQTEINELFNSVFGNPAHFVGNRTSPSHLWPVAGPPMNVWEEDNCFRIEAELPGFTMKDLEVTVLGDEITIRGERTFEESEGVTYLRRERRGGSFVRSWTLPTEIDADKVEASLRDGVLLVTLPKVAKAMPRKIEVKAVGS